jgi:acyl carrier protein
VVIVSRDVVMFAVAAAHGGGSAVDTVMACMENGPLGIDAGTRCRRLPACTEDATHESVWSMDAVSPASPDPEYRDSVVAGATHLPSPDEIQEWLVAYLAQLFEMDPGEIDVADPLAAYGVDSTAIVGLMIDLGSWLGRELEPEIFYSYPSIETLSRYLGGGGGR